MVTPRILLPVLLASMLCACAVQHVPATLNPVAEALPPKILALQAELALDTGYRRTLKAGGAWMPRGSVAQGDVYKPHMDIFTVEGAHIHEAWLVLQGDRLVGFYLPAERGFVPLTPPVSLHFQG